MMKFIPLRWLWCRQLLIGIVLMGIAVGLSAGDWLWRFDRLFYDTQLTLWQRSAPDDIIIVAIDEQSLAALGRWPWSRGVHAALIDKLTDAGARAVLVDIAFVQANNHDPAGDTALVEAVHRNARVLMPLFAESLTAGGQLVEVLPMPELAAATTLGHVDVELDRDGIARSVYLYAGLGTPYWANLGLALLDRFETQAALPFQPVAHDASAAQDSPYAWTRAQPILVPFAGPPGHFNRLSYIDVLEKDLPDAVFRDKYVFVGATATGLGDVLPTPASNTFKPMPGVEFNANVFDTLRGDLAIRPLADHWRLALNAVLVMIYLWLPARPYATTGLLCCTGAVTGILLYGFHLWFAPAPLLATLALAGTARAWRPLQRIEQRVPVDTATPQSGFR